MTIACERCGVQLAGIVCTNCGNVSTTPYSCSHCGFAFGATLCTTCSQSLASYPAYPTRRSSSSEMKTVCRNVAIILPISLILLIILLVVLGGI